MPSPASQRSLLYEIDKDTTPAGTPSSAFVVTIGVLAPQVVAPRVKEGEDLTLTATPAGSPSSYTWVLNGHTLSANQASVTLTWAELQALGINDGTAAGRGYSAFVVANYVPVSGSGTVSSGQGKFNVVVDNAAPTFGTFVSPATVDQGSAATVSISGASDPSPVDAIPTNLRYRFFNDDGSFDSGFQTSATFVISGSLLRHDGAVTIHGQVMDKDGGVVDGFATLTVVDVPPTLIVDNNAATRTAQEGASFTLDLKATDPGDDVLKSWDVDWGDNTTSHFVLDPASPNGNHITPTHVYADNGVYTISVGATDNNGSYTASAPVVTVSNVPAALVGTTVIPGTINENDSTRVTGRISDPGVLDSFTLNVNWGDGSASEQFQLAAGTSNFDVAHQYLQDGIYAVTLSVLDKDSTVPSTAGQAIVNVKVDNLAPVAGALTVQPGTVAEGDSVTVFGSYTDVGTLDRHIVSIDWGDGSAVMSSADPGTTIVIDPVKRLYSATHVYVDNPSGRPDYTISAVVTDETGATSNTVTANVVVQNVVPTFTEITLNDVPVVPNRSGAGPQPSTLTIDENGVVTIRGSFTDPGVRDGETVTIDWGEGGAPEQAVVSSDAHDPTLHHFTLSHRYLDDNPTNTPRDNYLVTATVVDKDGGTSQEVATLTVANVAPVADQIKLSTTSVLEDGKTVVVLTGHVSDIGTLDTVSKLEIDWGDGTAIVSMTTANAGDRISYDPVTRTFTASHRYLDDTPPGTPRDILTIKVTATDDDTGARTSTTPIEVINIAPKVSIHIDDPELYAAQPFTLKGSIADPGVLDLETVRINWGEGLFDIVVLQPGQRTFEISHAYHEPYFGHYVISVEVMDKDTGVGTAELAVVVHIPGSPAVPRIPNEPAGQLGTNVMAPIPDSPFRSTVFNSPDILWGGIKFGVLTGERGSPVKLALNLDELGGSNVSKVEIDWGDGNKETLDNPGDGTFDVAHAYSHVVGDDEIATGSISSSDRNGRSQAEVIIKTFKKGANGRDELTSITRYRLEEGGGVAPRIDKFTFNRSSTTAGDVDTVSGRVSYPGLPDAALLLVNWSDGTTSTGSIEERDGVFWFSATHLYSGKASLERIGLRFINTVSLKGVGSFEINPHSAASLDPTLPQASPPDQRRGDAAPSQQQKAASHAAGGNPLRTSDMALIFGAGLVVSQADPASFRLDRLLERTIRRKRKSTTKPRDPDRNGDWLTAPYRVADVAGVAANSRWHPVDDDWLITSDRDAAPPGWRGVTEGDADWMMIER